MFMSVDVMHGSVFHLFEMTELYNVCFLFFCFFVFNTECHEVFDFVLGFPKLLQCI